MIDNRSEFNRKFINDEVLFTIDVAEIIGKTRQQVINLVNSGKIKVAKNSKSGMLFLKSDVEEYLQNCNRCIFEHRNIIFGGTMKESIEYIYNNISNTDDIAYIKIYFPELDAVINGYYYNKNFNNQNELLLLKAPSFIVGFNDIKRNEIWLDTLKCGYIGMGTGATIDLLKNYFKITNLDIEDLIINNDVVELYKEDDIWRSKTVGIRDTYLRLSKMYMFNRNKVMLCDKMLLGEAHNIIEDYKYFINDIKDVTVYSKEASLNTGHFIRSSIENETYQLVIKSYSGNELWIPGYIDEDLPLLEQAEIVSILNEAKLLTKRQNKYNNILKLLFDNSMNNLKNRQKIVFERQIA